MPDMTIKRALIAVYDKTGIIDFARALVEEFGVEIVSTGGTARHLKEAGIPVTLVEEVTGFPEMLDGRVKTLHPKIHAAILADRDNPEHMRQLAEQGITPIDMVVVNLYPFEETIRKPDCRFDEAIEMIDIGGPCLLRAAAKNHQHVVVVTDIQDEDAEAAMSGLRENGEVSDLNRMGLAYSAFSRTSGYDGDIYVYFLEQRAHAAADRADIDSSVLDTEDVWFELEDESPVLYTEIQETLRYGENSHQRGALFVEDRSITYHRSAEASVAFADLLGGKEMSFNNYADADAALALCVDLARESAVLESSVCTFIKHTNACGVGMANDPLVAYQRAYLGDPNAAMGGVLAQNKPVTAKLAAAVMESLDSWGRKAGAGAFFVEVWLATEFEKEAVEVIRSRKKWGENTRLLAIGDMLVARDVKEASLRHITNGLLAQTRDLLGLNEDQWKVVTEREPSDGEMADLRLAWLVCKHTKSNAISICKDGMLIGNGAGQMSRVMSCRIATWLAKENGHEDKLKGAVAASDAFFPFRDGPDILADAGVTAIIQPGGSKRDAETIAACDERGLAMIFTGTRHFKH